MIETNKLTDLLLRIADGDNDAFEELYYETYQSVYAYLMSLTKDPDDAQDLMQDTYIRIRGACHLYKDQGMPMAWILRIAKNLFLMKIRKEGNRDNAISELKILDKSTFDNIEDVDTRMYLNKLFTQISEEERNIIILHVVGGLKNREIAEALGIPIGTVLSKYNRAIKKLQEIAGKEDVI